MTCIVGLAHGGTVWIGGDSAASDEDFSVAYKGPKVFRRGGGLLFGICDSFRLRDILRHDLTIPRRRRGQSDESFLVTDLVEEIRSTLDAAKFKLNDPDECEDVPAHGCAMIGYRGRLFTLDWDFHIDEVRDCFTAIGSGQDFALGSMYASGAWPPRERVRFALEASAHFTMSVRPPFRIISEH